MRMRVNYRLARVAIVLLASTWAFVASAAEKPEDPAKAAAEAKQREDLRVRSVKAGWLKGVRTVELIRADILSVTLDAGITGAIAPTMYIADSDVARHRAVLEPYAKPEAFTVTSPTDPDYKTPVRPADVGQCTYEGRNGVHAGKTLPSCTIFHTDCFLFLPKPMKSGHRYIVEVQPRGGRDAGLTYSGTLDYDDAKTPTKAIKINQVAYSSLSKQRYAYLGWWAGNKGKVDYAALKRFEVIDEKTGKAALTGEVRLRAGDEMTVKVAGEDIYEMDIAALPAGRYHIRIPGLGCSDPLEVGGKGIHALYYHALRAFFHQRCGQEFKEPWTWVKKPACHSEIYENGYFAPETLCPGEKNQDPKRIPPPGPDAKPRHFRGGYHDAADFDVLAGHLSATSELITLYDLFPEAFADRDLDLPESGNGIPDVLDNVEWLLRFFMQNQYPDGAIPASKPNMSDGLTQWRAKDPNFTGKGYNDLICAGKAPPFGVVPPCDNSTTLFAASAARFSRLVRPFNAAMADRYLASAKKAFEYAISHTPMETYTAYTTERYPLHKPDNDKPWAAGSPANHTGMKGWVAAELMRATGDKSYNHYIDEALTVGRGMWGPLREIRWAYLNLGPAVADPALQAKCRKDYLSKADELVSATSKDVNRTGYGNGESVGWGAGNPVGYFMTLVSAYGLTKDQKYLDATSFNADYLLGEMPISWCWLTHMGYRSPQNPWMSYYLWDKYTPGDDFSNFGAPMAGYNIYGLGWSWGDWFDKGAKRPVRRYWNDFTIGFGGAAWCQSSEFTPNTLTGAACGYACLYAEAVRQGLATKVKMDPLSRAVINAANPAGRGAAK